MGLRGISGLHSMRLLYYTGLMVLAPARSRTKERVMARIPRLCAKEQGKRLAEVAKEIAEDDTRSYDGHFRGYMKGW
jgi:hypothetical protein